MKVGARWPASLNTRTVPHAWSRLPTSRSCRTPSTTCSRGTHFSTPLPSIFSNWNRWIHEAKCLDFALEGRFLELRLLSHVVRTAEHFLYYEDNSVGLFSFLPSGDSQDFQKSTVGQHRFDPLGPLQTVLGVVAPSFHLLEVCIQHDRSLLWHGRCRDLKVKVQCTRFKTVREYAAV